MISHVRGSNPGPNATANAVTIKTILSLGENPNIDKRDLLKIAQLLVLDDPFACAAELQSGSIDSSFLRQLALEFNDLVELFFPDHPMSGNQKIVFQDRDDKPMLSSKEQFSRLRALTSDVPTVRIYGSDQIAFEYQAEIIPGTHCKLILCRNFSFEVSERGSALLGCVISSLEPASEDYFLRMIFEEGSHIKLGEAATEFEVKIERERLMGWSGKSTSSTEQILQEVLVNYTDRSEEQRKSLIFALSSIESMDFEGVFRFSLQAHSIDRNRMLKLEQVIEDALTEGNRVRSEKGWTTITRS